MIVEKLGGRICFESEENKGSKFSFTVKLDDVSHLETDTIQEFSSTLTPRSDEALDNDIDVNDINENFRQSSLRSPRYMMSGS
jgi:hypothetical protein